jgi:chemotaxis protein methyltransferase CheR
MTEPALNTDVEALELELLLEGLYRRYGFDFRNYSKLSLRRRVQKTVLDEGLETISDLQRRVLRDGDVLNRLLRAVSINVTSMYRHPPFFAAFREHVVPVLATYPVIRIWHAGCSTGEEVYSMAILLAEEGLYERTKLYATDLSDEVLTRAKRGVFPLPAMREYTVNYQLAGGKSDFSRYYRSDDKAVVFDAALRRNIVFACHDLATNASFNEFNVIVCRNVMIYFDPQLQDRVHRLFHDSLCPFGVLGLGEKENLVCSSFESHYEEIAAGSRLYRRRG